MKSKNLANEMLIKGFSLNQIETYCNHVQGFFDFIRRPVFEIENKDVEGFKQFMIEMNYSPARINSALIAIKFYLKTFFNNDISIVLMKKVEVPVVIPQ